MNRLLSALPREGISLTGALAPRVAALDRVTQIGGSRIVAAAVCC